MLTFSFIEKSNAAEILPGLFNILYDNMNSIAPTGEGYERDFEEWYGNVAPALERPQRNIILIREDGALVGFFQYYVNETTFMMEEIQLVKAARGRGIFEALYRHLKSIVPPETPFVEAYAHELNLHSQGILRHLGLEEIGRANRCLHFRGSMSAMFETLENSPVPVPEFTVI